MLYLGVSCMPKWDSNSSVKSVKVLKTVAFCLLSFFCFSLSSHADDKKQSQPVAVTVEHVKQAYFYDVVQEVGKVKSIDSADLSFNADNKITKIFFHNGDKVRKGDLIAQLDDSDAKADFDKSKSSLALAKTKLARINELLQREPYALSKETVDETKEEVDLAKADYQQKSSVMNNYQIIAPFDGQLTTFQQSVGSHIAAGTALVRLYSLNPVEVSYAISQIDFGKAQKDQKVSVTVDAYKDRVFYGKVNYVAPAIDEQSGRVAVRSELDNPDFALAPGMFANIKHYFGHRISELLIPQNSVVAENDKRFVWVVNKNRVEKRPITLGKNTNSGFVVVTKGVKEGEPIVKTGIQNLKEDSTIRILPNIQPANDANAKKAAEANDSTKSNGENK
ncbi:efflux RND transporter periplasmic adaptor subunit [Shewanella sp. 202IG2-18]|nr:efflux RND transporter periplasmic adaptor subunit [Parashewanella hymeniacidonis]